MRQGYFFRIPKLKSGIGKMVQNLRFLPSGLPEGVQRYAEWQESKVENNKKHRSRCFSLFLVWAILTSPRIIRRYSYQSILGYRQREYPYRRSRRSDRKEYRSDRSGGGGWCLERPYFRPSSHRSWRQSSL